MKPRAAERRRLLGDAKVSMVRIIRLLSALAGSMALVGCAEVPTAEVPIVCTRELRVHFVPGDTTIMVGATFTASVELSSCGRQEVLSDVFTWESGDGTVAQVDAKTGVVTAMSVGETAILVTGQRYGNVGGFTVGVEPAAQ
jgi:hypothetical protein